MYLWQAGTALPLTLTNLNLLEEYSIRFKITPKKEEQIVLTMTNQAPDRVHILNDYWLQQLSQNSPALGPIRSLRMFQALDKVKNQLVLF